MSCLRHLIVVQSCDDVEDYIRTHFFDYELDEFMDMYPFADDDAIGLFWFYANCPIVFAKNIRDAVRDLAQTTFLNENEEYQRGILTTALHEIYHLGASSRFFPQFEDTEDAAEQFCVFFPI